MKLLFLTESIESESDGPAAAVIRLTELMVRQAGVQVTVACLTPRQQSLLLPPNVGFFQLAKPVFPQFSWLRATADLRRLISQHDVVFSFGIWGPIDGFALRIARKLHKPVYIRVCGTLKPYIQTRNPFKKQLARLLYLQQNLHEATGVIVDNELEVRYANQLGVSVEKTIIIPDGVRLIVEPPNPAQARRHLGLSADRPVLLYLGQLHPKRGLHVLLQAMALLPTYKRNFCFLVAGAFCDAQYQQEIEKLVHTNGLQELVHFSKQVTGAAKELHFRAADGFIMPAQSEGIYSEVLEAMAHGLPVMVTKKCNLPEVADYKAGLVVGTSVANLTWALNWFVTDGSSLTAASSGALRLMRERFNPEQIVQNYQLILAKHASAQSNSARRQNVSLE